MVMMESGHRLIAQFLAHCFVEILKLQGIYNGIFWSQDDWNGLSIWRCSHLHVEEYQAKVFATLKSYLSSDESLSVKLVTFNAERSPILEWKFHVSRQSCTSSANLNLANMKSILSSIAVGVSMIPPFQAREYTYAVFIDANTKLSLPPQCTSECVATEIKNRDSMQVHKVSGGEGIEVYLSHLKVGN